MVYPAGFLYIFRFLRWVTGGGLGASSVRIAQWIFLGIYLTTEAVILALYERARYVGVYVGTGEGEGIESDMGIDACFDIETRILNGDKDVVYVYGT